MNVAEWREGRLNCWVAILRHALSYPTHLLYPISSIFRTSSVLRFPQLVGGRVVIHAQASLISQAYLFPPMVLNWGWFCTSLRTFVNVWSHFWLSWLLECSSIGVEASLATALRRASLSPGHQRIIPSELSLVLILRTCITPCHRSGHQYDVIKCHAGHEQRELGFHFVITWDKITVLIYWS